MATETKMQHTMSLDAPDAPSAMTSITCVHSKQPLRAVRNLQPAALAKCAHSQVISVQGALRQARRGDSAREHKHASCVQCQQCAR